MRFSLKSLAVGVIGLAVVVGQAEAQTRKPAAPAAPAAPAQPAPAPAPAPQGEPGQLPPGPMKVDLSPTQNEWTKICGRDQSSKEICYTTRDFGSQPEQPPVLAVAVYDVKGDDTRIVRLLMPVGLMLRPGFRLTIDKNAAVDGNFEICFPNGCFAETRIKGAAQLDQFKKGTLMAVAVRNQVGNEVDFSIPLAGFGKAFDGPAIDPKVLEEQQKKLQEQLQKRAEDERKKLEAAQPPAAAPAAPPAPAAAPAPAAK